MLCAVCRHKEDKDKPGVGAYTLNNNALGKQALSSKKTLPSAKIGTSDRDAAKKVNRGRHLSYILPVKYG